MKQLDAKKRTRIAYIGEAGFEYFLSLFVTTNFLVYLLQDLGVSDALSGILSNVSSFTLLAQLFALWVKRRQVKRLVTWMHIVSQLCFCLIYLLPFLSMPLGGKTGLLLVFLVVGYLIHNAVNPVKIGWLMGFVPDGTRGSFTGIKEILSLLGGMGVTLGFGALAEHFEAKGDMLGYYRTCLIAMIALAVLHTVTLLLSSESGESEAEVSVDPFSLRMRRIFGSSTLPKIIGVEFIWAIAFGISVPFFASYQLNELGFGLGKVTMFATIGSLCRMAATPLIGKLADRFSFAVSMTVSFLIAGVGFACAVFAAPGAAAYLIVGYVLLHSLASAGINSGTINLIFDYVPPADRSAALGAKNTVLGIVNLLASVAAGAILGKVQAAGGFRIFGMTFYAQQGLAAVSLLLVLLLVVYIRFVILPLRRTTEKVYDKG